MITNHLKREVDRNPASYANLIYLSVALQLFVLPWPLFQFLNLFTPSVGLLGRGIRPSQGRYLHTEQHKHK
jgi:polyferredoxin